MIQTRNAAELMDYLLTLELINPAFRSKLVKNPFGPVAARVDNEHGYRSMQFFIEQGKPFGTLKLSGFTARVVRLPAYSHIVSQHMSTAELEDRMAAVDWNKEAYKINLPGNNPVESVFNDALFLRLAGNQPARDIVDILLLKYCDVTPAINMVPYKLHDKPFVREMHVDLDHSIRDLTLSQSWNLLEDRFVLKFSVPGDKHSAAWYSYNGTTLEQHPVFDLPGVLSAVPIAGNPSFERRVPLYLKLMNGDAIEVKIRPPGGKAIPAVLKVDATTGSIVGKNAAGAALRFDTVDPDVQAKREAAVDKMYAAKKKRNNKGRSI